MVLMAATGFTDRMIAQVRISAIVDACFRLIVDGVSAPSWTHEDARKRV
jgi:hypothetical protein